MISPRLRVSPPLLVLLVVIGVVHAIALTWGLPASDGWDDDGIAPRDFLVGVVETYTPGAFFTYPPVHLLILAILNAPLAIATALRAPSFAPHDLVHQFIQVPTMTAFAIVARVVAVAMSLGIVLALAKIGEELRGGRAGWWVAACAGVNWSFTYYAHTSNLDVPYLFWASFALLYVVRAIARREPRVLRRAAVLAALAIGTKDQAYAVFLLSVPSAIALWLAMDRAIRPRWREVARESAIAAGIAAAILAVVDGAVVNPRGFRARVAFLLGTASQDHAQYTKGLHAYYEVVRDGLSRFDWFYPIVLAPFVLAGIAIAWRARRADAARGVAGMVPLLAVVSFTLAFNCTARRTEHRFLLPQSLFVAVYAGLAWDVAYEWLASRTKPFVAQLAAAACFAWGLYLCLAVDVNLLYDPRYDAERWLAANVAPGDVIEVYGNNVYLPRFPPGARVVRVGPEPIAKRSPLPNVTEVEGAYADAPARAPKWIVVSEGWVWRYTLPWELLEQAGMELSTVQREAKADAASRAFFGAIHANAGGWHRAHTSAFESRFWPRVDIHASTSREIRVFERDGADAPSSFAGAPATR